ncbi:MAG: TonB-dependent receptor [Bacteroidetes bacterium]|nr:TonB-dependent receptor [Bacteroidota bacterium]
MKQIWFFLLTFSTYLCLAQQSGTIEGVVYSDSSALPLASVKLLKSNYTIASDSAGRFRFTDIAEGRYQLRISYIGFENYQAEVKVLSGNTATVNAIMVPLTERLKEVVISGSLKEARKLESITPVEVYTSKYFQRNPTSNLFEALQQVNGLYADIDNGVANTNDVQINGLEGNYTMFLIDGVPCMNGLAGIYALNALPMQMIDKIEIVKGAASTLYGSEAIGGIINIKTKNTKESPRFFANGMLTSMLQANVDIGGSFRVSKASSIWNVSSESFNTVWDVDKNNFRDMPFINRVHLFNKWTISRSEDRVFDLYACYLFEDRFGGDKYPPVTWRGNPKYYTESVRTHQWQAGIKYQLPVAEKILFQLDYNEHHQSGYYGTVKYDGLQAGLFTQLNWNKKIDPHNDLIAGISYRAGYFDDNTDLTKPALTGYSNLHHLAAVFFEDEISLGHLHKLLIGARLEYTSRTFPMAMPRLCYKWNSRKMTDILRIGAGSGYRIPSVLNEGFGAMNGSRRVVIEGKLLPEIAISANAGYTRVQEFADGLVNLDANIFYTYFLNMVNPEYPADTGLIVYENSSGGAMAGGVSINADFSFNFPLKFGIGITYSRTVEFEKQEDGKVEKEIPTHQPPFTAQFYLSYNFPQPQLSIDWTGSVVSPMYLSVVQDDFRPEKSKWHTIQNIQLTKRFKAGVELYFGIKNFFNFIQKDPILRPFDPFNQNINVNNPNNYRFDTTYGFTSTQGIKGFAGVRYTLK